jgi:hypothetical protein
LSAKIIRTGGKTEYCCFTPDEGNMKFVVALKNSIGEQTTELVKTV